MTTATIPVVSGLRGQYVCVWSAPERPNLWPAAVTSEEQEAEQREETALCDAESLSEFISTSRQVFESRHWRMDALNIRNDYLYAKNYRVSELFSLMLLSSDKAVILACRDEIKSRYLAEVIA